MLIVPQEYLSALLWWILIYNVITHLRRSSECVYNQSKAENSLWTFVPLYRPHPGIPQFCILVEITTTQIRLAVFWSGANKYTILTAMRWLDHSSLINQKYRYIALLKSHLPETKSVEKGLLAKFIRVHQIFLRYCQWRAVVGTVN